LYQEIKTNISMETNIIEIDHHLFTEDDERGLIDLYPLKDPQIGDEVFWIDPTYWRGGEHASKWGIITDIRGEIIELDNGTETFLDELYW
jgi:hypothetical protein